jgi:hypothetical protein
MTMQDTIKTVNDMTNNSVERMTSLGEINMRVAERMMSWQMDLMTRGIEQGTAYVRAASEARGYSDLYKTQLEMAKEASEQLMTDSKASLAFATEARDDYRAWFQGALADMRQQSGAENTASA